MKSVLTLVALLTMTATFAPSARAQDSGRWETRVVTETTPGHWETRSKQVWQEPWVEVESRKTADGTVEHVKVEHPGRWKTVTERVWVEPTTKKVEKKVWVAAASEYSKPWDDTPRTATGRTEQPTRELPSTRTEQPTAPRTLAGR